MTNGPNTVWRHFVEDLIKGRRCFHRRQHTVSVGIISGHPRLAGLGAGYPASALYVIHDGLSLAASFFSMLAMFFGTESNEDAVR